MWTAWETGDITPGGGGGRKVKYERRLISFSTPHAAAHPPDHFENWPSASVEESGLLNWTTL